MRMVSFIAWRDCIRQSIRLTRSRRQILLLKPFFREKHGRNGPASKKATAKVNEGLCRGLHPLEFDEDSDGCLWVVPRLRHLKNCYLADLAIFAALLADLVLQSVVNFSCNT